MAEIGRKRRISIFKGILERLFLIIGLITGYPQVIIAFGALKIGTRFQKNSRISNDYFLIGAFSNKQSIRPVDYHGNSVKNYNPCNLG